MWALAWFVALTLFGTALVGVAVGLALLPAGVVGMWALGELSYRFVETPLLHLKERLGA